MITFEHDQNLVLKNSGMREAQREILDSLGYALVVRDQHEDWWVDRTQISYPEYKHFFRINSM